MIIEFSNGIKQIYTGKRKVRAAWLLLAPGRQPKWGVSNSMDNAKKTAEINAGEMSSAKSVLPKSLGPVARLDQARANGFPNSAAMEKSVKAQRARFVQSCHIEIVEVPK